MGLRTDTCIGTPGVGACSAPALDSLQNELSIVAKVPHLLQDYCRALLEVRLHLQHLAVDCCLD